METAATCQDSLTRGENEQKKVNLGKKELQQLMGRDTQSIESSFRGFFARNRIYFTVVRVQLDTSSYIARNMTRKADRDDSNPSQCEIYTSNIHQV